MTAGAYPHGGQVSVCHATRMHTQDPGVQLLDVDLELDVDEEQLRPIPPEPPDIVWEGLTEPPA